MSPKNHFILVLILVIILFAGCSTNDNADLLCFDIENTKSKTVTFDDIFEIEKIIILEETQESLVSHIIKVDYVNNNFFISDNRHGVVLRFDDNGNFINSIGQRGNGPGEIGRLSNFRIDNEYVYLLDRAKVVKYEIDGTFIEDLDKRYYTIDFDYRNNKYIFYNINVPSYDQFVITDSINTILKSFSPLRNSPMVMGMPGRDYLYYHQGDYFYISVFRYNISFNRHAFNSLS
ncbi:MAG: 6-bladed beta-propeller [Bacteroidales bacterium]|nr:6-bladed beta-propeller [Bacteroidales bacterium]